MKKVYLSFFPLTILTLDATIHEEDGNVLGIAKENARNH